MQFTYGFSIASALSHEGISQWARMCRPLLRLTRRFWILRPAFGLDIVRPAISFRMPHVAKLRIKLRRAGWRPPPFGENGGAPVYAGNSENTAFRFPIV